MDKQGNRSKTVKFSTKAIHVGQEPEATTGAVAVPIYQTSTYAQEELGKHKGYEYARTQNPTRSALEECLASLDSGKHGLAFSSGLGATNTVMNLLSQGDHVVVGDDVYGGTYRIFEKVYRRYGVDFTYIDARDPANFEKAIRPETKMLWLETPTNPLLRLADIKALSTIAKSKKITCVVDNTFASPYLQRPLELGADLVVYSTTKYLGGHSDVVGGGVVCSDDSIHEVLRFHQNAVGAVPGPFDCWLVLRGIKTLSVRMREHEKNAMAIAKFLESHKAIEKVYYPGLSSHSQHDLAKKQMHGFGGMVSCVVRGGLENARAVLNNTKLFTLAESLGGVESLIGHPATMTHASIPRESREERGIVDGLIRLSAGIEDVEDLIADLDKALAKANQPALSR
ncbi:MAG: cystathionine gamma-synthase [Candidatus Obscuribacterales bacterium]|nr:cystathionine gamma-synthase [Candidatus Obscuribacterales bacterium]